MAAYTYIAKDPSGNKFSGTYQDIPSVRALRAELANIDCRLIKAQKAKKQKQIRSRRIPDKDVVSFAFQFAGMYSAGLSVLQSLDTLTEQTKNPTLKLTIADIREGVETGASLKKAFTKHESIFGQFFVGMIEAGEAGGKLGESLELSAKYLEKRAELKSRVKAAFLYPLIVGLVSLTVIGSLLMFVVPMFDRLYKRLHVPLPTPTYILMVLSDFLRSGWPFILIGGGICWFVLRSLLKDQRFRALWDYSKLYVPIFGRLNQIVIVSRFIRTLATLTSVGVPLIDCIEVARVVANNVYWNRIAVDIRESIRAGNPIAMALQEHSIFPVVVVHMADSGEHAGVLSEMLFKGADFLDKDIDRLVDSLLTKLEPLLTVVLGAIIGLLLMGIYLPMFDYMNHIK